MTCRPQFKPVNMYGSKWLQCFEDSSDRLEMVSPMMRNYHLHKNAQELIFQEMAQQLNRPTTLVGQRQLIGNTKSCQAPTKNALSTLSKKVNFLISSLTKWLTIYLQIVYTRAYHSPIEKYYSTIEKFWGFWVFWAKTQIESAKNSMAVEFQFSAFADSGRLKTQFMWQLRFLSGRNAVLCDHSF